jgi:hypothetical protein
VACNRVLFSRNLETKGDYNVALFLLCVFFCGLFILRRCHYLRLYNAGFRIRGELGTGKNKRGIVRSLGCCPGPVLFRKIMRNVSQQPVSWPRFEPGVSRIQITIKPTRYVALMTLPWKHVVLTHLHRWHLNAQNCTSEG